MPNNIKICKQNQLDLLRSISIETYRDTFSESNSETLMTQYFQDALNKEKLQAELNHPDSSFYFICVAEKVAGFLKVNVMSAQTDIKDSNALEIERFYIRKSFLRNGLGKELMDFAGDLARKKNKDFIWLGVWENNIPALHFYKQMGFYQIGTHPFNMAGDIQTDLLLQKDL
ncbi:GNAT family N-acetyltransferase [Psychromonas sp. MB-3u-54]|uniref:GNAT family N-acetyltransferase n=1 Tax=Psychromonas sp. MB-3u-54 TaxID=2058319 RepID=UPI001E49ECCC|nr:GNAT family N-acetyltransferase [Psychromonas sp. MB-3u-54]